MKKNLWILTEERPKKEVLKNILNKFVADNGFTAFIDTLRIFPILTNERFTFTYEISGFRSNRVNKIYLKSISGYSSFVDFLVFYQDKEPTTEDTPIYAIEETKTDDKESRNTGVYQRCAKFVFIENYYPNTRKIMLYNLQITQKKTPTETYIFGTKLLLTLGVEILGKELEKKIFTPFKSIKEVIDLKSNMRNAPRGNVPISIKKYSDRIEISGRLWKGNNLAHDPNIGALSIICSVLRKLGWEKRIVITQHGLEQKHLKTGNKFIKIANKQKISLKDLSVPKVEFDKKYWKYDLEGEKLGTIFVHIVVENFTQGHAIFENHAGCEKGYFITKEGTPIILEKYKNRTKYKAGKKDEIIFIPDLILVDFNRNEVINIEGKKYKFRQNGIAELSNYDSIENLYIKKHYPKFKIIRTVVLYGSKKEQIIEMEIGFLLNKNGQLIVGIKAPKLFQEAIKNLLNFWS